MTLMIITTCKSLTTTKYVSVLYSHMIYRCSLLTKFANLSNVISDMVVTNVGTQKSLIHSLWFQTAIG